MNGADAFVQTVWIRARIRIEPAALTLLCQRTARETSAGFRRRGSSSATGAPAASTSWAWPSSSPGEPASGSSSMMSLLIFAVGWAYSQICRIYPDGGGVYTAAKQTSRTLAVVGALLLFADYTVTASLSVLDAFHYFGLPLHKQVDPARAPRRRRAKPSRPRPRRPTSITTPATRHRRRQPARPQARKPAFGEGEAVRLGFARPLGDRRHRRHRPVQHDGAQAHRRLRHRRGRGHGLHHAADLRLRAAAGSLARSAAPHRQARFLPSRPALGRVRLDRPGPQRRRSHRQPHRRHAPPRRRHRRKAIWVVATEVAVFNIILAVCMLAIFPINRDAPSGRHGRVSHRPLRRRLGRMGRAHHRRVAAALRRQHRHLRHDLHPVPDGPRRRAARRRWCKLNRFGVPWIPA